MYSMKMLFISTEWTKVALLLAISHFFHPNHYENGIKSLALSLCLSAFVIFRWIQMRNEINGESGVYAQTVLLPHSPELQIIHKNLSENTSETTERAASRAQCRRGKKRFIAKQLHVLLRKSGVKYTFHTHEQKLLTLTFGNNETSGTLYGRGRDMIKNNITKAAADNL